MVPWTDDSPEERARGTLQYNWSRWGSWKPSDWLLALAVIRDGTVVGTQDVGGRDFAVLREVHTGSWLGRRYQGQGIGTQMRAAVLHLAFDGLGARWAISAAFEDNPASLGVSRKPGYRDDGIEWYSVRGRPALSRRLRLGRSGWKPPGRSRCRSMACRPACPYSGCPPVRADASASARLVISCRVRTVVSMSWMSNWLSSRVVGPAM